MSELLRAFFAGLGLLLNRGSLPDGRVEEIGSLRTSVLFFFEEDDAASCVALLFSSVSLIALTDLLFEAGSGTTILPVVRVCVGSSNVDPAVISGNAVLGRVIEAVISSSSLILFLASRSNCGYAIRRPSISLTSVNCM